MKLAYVDSSCLVSIAFDEPDAKETAERLTGFGRLLSSNLLEAELRSALSRERVEEDCAPLLSWIGWVYPDRPLTREYRVILDRGHARGADLWHLACALFLKGRLGSLTFATLDRRQRDLARAVALEV